MGKVVILEPNRPKREIETDELSLAAAQALVGGDVELIYVTYMGAERPMLLDEEGKFKPNPQPNAAATNLLHASGGRRDDVVVGAVIILVDVEF